MAAALALTACAGTPLSGREIVRAAFFGPDSVLLLLADESAPEGETAYKTALGRGDTPARALQTAAAGLDGRVFYGLMDVVGLPADCDRDTAAQIGTLLYSAGKPAPELAVFLLHGDETPRNAAQVYEELLALETGGAVHCGLQTLFAQEDVCAVPVRQESGYGFALLPKTGEPALFDAAPAAQLAAVLCGQADRLDVTFADIHCTADAEVTVLPQRERTDVQLHLRHLALKSLSGEASAPEAALRAELLAAFAALCQTAQAQNSDPLRLRFWTAVKYGPGTAPAPPRLVILPE